MTRTYSSLLELGVGAVLVCAVLVLWLGTIRSVLRSVAAQGWALGAVAGLLGIHTRDVALVATSVVVVALKGITLPLILRRLAGADLVSRDVRSIVNVPASLISAAALTLLAFVATRHLGSLVAGPGGTLLPVGFATLLVGFFVLVARSKPVFQMVGVLLVDNGVASIAFLLSSGVPFLIELGVSLDLLLGVVVLVALGSRLTAHHGDVGLDLLRELHD